MNHFYENQDYFQDYDYSFDNSLDLCQYSTYLYDNFYNYNQHAYFQQPAQEAEVDNTKSKKKKSHSSKHHHKDKNSDKYLSNYFQSDYCQPVCIAIGDIEGNTQKLHSIINFIKSTDFNFVFIGDIFDDISDSSPKRKNGFKCIEMISEFFLPIRDECNLSFKDIRFEEKKFSEIPSRVKFIAGNSECDVLKDIIDTKEIKQNSSGKYTFGKGKYTKTFSEEQLSILYRYFKNCCGVITLNRNNSHNKKHQNNFSFVDSVFFRHSQNVGNSFNISKYFEINIIYS